MTDPKKPTRVIAIGESGPTQQQITTALAAQSEFLILDSLTSLEFLPKEIRAAQPEIILMDHEIGSETTLDAIDELAIQFPEIPIIAILPSADPVRAQQVMLAGARAFIVQPFTQVNLLSTLRRVIDLESRRKHSQGAVQTETTQSARLFNTLAVFSPRGGVGCSTMALNLAIAMREETDQRVLLLEGKLLFGHLGMMLNIRTPNSIVDLIPYASSLDKGLVNDVVAKHASGIEVLLSPSDVQVGQGVRPEDLYNVLKNLQALYDFIIIDAGSHLTENAVTLMDSADRVLLVTNPDLATLHDISRFIQISRGLAFPEGKVLIVLNRSDIKGGVKKRDIESALRNELFAEIPEDGPNVLRSLNRGVPLIVKYPRSPVSKSIKRLAKNITYANPGEPAGIRSPAGFLKRRKDAGVVSSQTP